MKKENTPEARDATRLEPCCPPIGIARIELSLSPCILLFVVVVEGCGGGEVAPVHVVS